MIFMIRFQNLAFLIFAAVESASLKDSRMADETENGKICNSSGGLLKYEKSD